MPKTLKDKRIQIVGINEETERQEVIAEVWAHVRSMSVQEGFNCGADFAWNNVYFTIFKPKSFTVTTYNEIVYKGETYYIEGIDLFDDVTGQNMRIHARARY